MGQAGGGGGVSVAVVLLQQTGTLKDISKEGQLRSLVWQTLSLLVGDSEGGDYDTIQRKNETVVA